MGLINFLKNIKIKVMLLYKQDKIQKFLLSTIPTILVYGFMFNLLFYSFGYITLNICYVLSLGFLWVFLYEDFTNFINKMK